MSLIEEHAYDAIPYRDDAYFHSQPARIAAAATLYGLKPPRVQTAHVLEVGCAGGGNLLPLAMRYPAARFLGIDLSGVQIAMGKKRSAELGLTNIHFKKASITDVTVDDGRFDYILAHGVFSWVPEAVRLAVLRVMHDNLNDDGIAYMSYNVLPGWQLKRIVRDIMLFAEEGIQDPHLGVSAARNLLGMVAQSANGAYGQVLRGEVTTLTGAADSYLRHDHMEPENAPMYFKDIVALAQSYGLEYLVESDPVTTIPECVKPESAHLIRQYGAHDPIQMEQYLDYFVGRSFRMSLFVKQTQQLPKIRVIRPDSLDDLHFSVRLVLERVENASSFAPESDVLRFGTYKNVRQRITVQTQLFVRAMNIITHASQLMPATLTLRQLACAATGTEQPSQEEEEAIRSLVILLLHNQMIYAYATAMPSQPVTEKPCVDRLVRTDALQKRAYTVNLLHENFRFDHEDQRTLVSLLDGTRDHAALLAEFGHLGSAGAATFIESTLLMLSRMHLLVG